MKYSKICLLFACSLPLIGCNDETSDWDKNVPPESAITLSIAEGTTLTEPLNATSVDYVQVYLSEPSQHDFTIHYTTADDTATSDQSNSDYHYQASTNASVAVNIGDERVKLPITVRNNQLHENDVSFTLSFTADNSSYLIPENSYAINIKNSDPVPGVNFDTVFTNAKEGDSNLSYSLTLSHRTTSRLEIIITQSGTATANEDYTLLTPLPLVIEPKSLTSSIDLNINTDTNLEYSELIAFSMDTTGTYQPGERGKLSILIAGDTSQNDTGLTTVYDGNTFNASGPNAEYPGQDAERGRDITDPSPIDGHAGYSFLKHNYAGEPLDENSSNYACIQDQTTGLYIEAKGDYLAPLSDSVVTIDKRIQDYKDDPDANSYPSEYKTQSSRWNNIAGVYTWYEPDATLNNNVPGSLGSGFTHSDYPVSSFCSFPDSEMANYDPSSQNCNSNTYIAKLNSNGVCGFKDWRLPTPSELRSFLILDTSVNPNAIDYFPPRNQLINSTSSQQLVWTSASAINTPASAWCVDIETAKAHLCNKNTFNTTISVRGGVEQ